MLTSLQAITNKSRRDKKHKFGNLFGILCEDFLMDSWRSMNRGAAPGIDQITAKDYSSDLKGNIRNLVKRVKENRYRAKLVKRVFIPKSGGGQRPNVINLRFYIYTGFRFLIMSDEKSHWIFCEQ